MKKRFQLFVSIATFLIILGGFSLLTIVIRKMIQEAIREQVIMDNKAIGEEVLNFLDSSISYSNDGNLIDNLQNICEEVMLPNSGFICVSRNDGSLVAAPGLKPDDDKSLEITTYEERKPGFFSKFISFNPDKIYQGVINFENGKKSNIIASIPIGNEDLRLNVHQDVVAIESRAREAIKHLIPVGIIAALILSFLGYIVVNRIVRSYESTIENQNIIIRARNEEITASIRYARFLQSSYLPSRKGFEGSVSDYFVFQKPKDIVSGDFFWIDAKDDILYFAAIDCTGHGVPGSLLSMISYGLLEQALHEQNLEKPADILNFLCKRFGQASAGHIHDTQIRDGMDIAICSYNRNQSKLQYSGAKNPLWLFRNKEFIEYKATRLSIGGNEEKEGDCFINNEINIETGDKIYLFSDGFADQFGGPNNKKFMKKRLSNLLAEIYELSMEEQSKRLDSELNQWIGKNEQIDDILILGITL